MTDQLNPEDRALIERIVPKSLRVFFTGVRVAEWTAKLLAAARTEGRRSGEDMCSPGGLTVIDHEQWEPCSPAWLAAHPHDCGSAPRVYNAAEGNHYHPKNWPSPPVEAKAAEGPYDPISGFPITGVDEGVRPLVAALWAAGIGTIASCDGHGHRPGNIVLRDGRELMVLPNYETGRRVDQLFPIGINGEPVARDEASLPEGWVAAPRLRLRGPTNPTPPSPQSPRSPPARPVA